MIILFRDFWRDKVLTLEMYNKSNDLVKNWFLVKNDNFVIISEDIVNKTNKLYIIKYKSEIGIIYFTFETERNCITTFFR